jgi:microcystin-dependent protein
VESVTLNQLQMPSHTHSASLSNVAVRANNGNGDQADPTGHFPAKANFIQDRNPQEVRSYAASANTNMATEMFSGQVTIGNTGGNQSHENMPPFQVIPFVIALQGVFPSRN